MMLFSSNLLSLFEEHSDSVVLFGLWFNIRVNSYGHVERVSKPSHTFFLGKLRLLIGPHGPTDLVVECTTQVQGITYSSLTGGTFRDLEQNTVSSA